jgi:hypothetical protein
MIITDTISLKRIGRRNCERSVGVNGSQRRAGCAGRGGLAHCHHGVSNRMACGAKNGVVLANPYAAAGLAVHAAQASASIATRITFLVAPNLFFTLAIVFIPSSRRSQICSPTSGSILIRFHHRTNGETTRPSRARDPTTQGKMIG